MTEAQENLHDRENEQIDRNEQADRKVYYKLLGGGRIGPYSGYKWPAVGEWTESLKGKLEACQKGYHVADSALGVQFWGFEGAHLYEVELEQEPDRLPSAFVGGEKIFGRRARLTKYLGQVTLASLNANGADPLSIPRGVLFRFEYLNKHADPEKIDAYAVGGQQ